jgi:hypothetical protein
LVLRRDVGKGARRVKRSVAGPTFTKLTRKLATRYFSFGQIDFQSCGLSFLVSQHSIFFVDGRDEGLQLTNCWGQVLANDPDFEYISKLSNSWFKPQEADY